MKRLVYGCLLAAAYLVSCGEDAAVNPTTAGEEDCHTVSGRIVDGQGRGIGNVDVALSGADSTVTAVTGDTGIFTFRDVEEGLYVLSCTREGYVFQMESDNVAVGGMTVLPVIVGSMKGPLDVTLVRINAPAEPYVMNADNDSDYYVRLSDYAMSLHEITNGQYTAYLNEALLRGEITVTDVSVIGGTGVYRGFVYYELDRWDAQIEYGDGGFAVLEGMDYRPVGNVTWYGARAFALYYGFDLPTEAEWQYAASGGRYYHYATDDSRLDTTKARYSDGPSYTVDVGLFPPNPFGLYDMTGNVSEWCIDWYGDYPEGTFVNPSGPERGVYKVAKGGSWGSNAWECRVEHRRNRRPENGANGVGFRLVRRFGGE